MPNLKQSLLNCLFFATVFIISGIVLVAQPQFALAFTPSYISGSGGSSYSTNSSSYTPSYSTNSSSYTPSYSTNSSSYTPSYSTNSSSYTPSYSTNSSSYDTSYYSSDWLSCGYSTCETTYTYTYTPTVYVPSCTDECSVSGQRVCEGNGYKTCGNYDSDSCLEWSSVTSCGWGQTCSNGSCITSCSDECSISGQRRCWGNGYQQCGNYDSDSCLEWGDGQACGWNETCVNGSCISSCTDECSVSGQRVCEGNGYKTCGNYDSDSCLEWSSVTSCGWGQTCSNGSCQATCTDECSSGQRRCSGNGYQICGNYDSDSCTEWGDGQACGWNETCSNGYCSSQCQPKTCSQMGYECGQWNDGCGNMINCGSCGYNQTCSNGRCSGGCDNLNVSAGSDKYVDAGDSVRLDGSVDGNYDRVYWSCTGGSLSSSSTLQPLFYAPSWYNYDYDNYNCWDYDRTYTCTITAYNQCGSDSDTMTVRVRGNYDCGGNLTVSLIARPKSACAPLYGVDMIATLSNYGSYNRDFTYYFDCQNDGTWEKIITTDDTSYTVNDLCNYPNVGSYTARVRVESRGRTATDTDIVRSESCGAPYYYGTPYYYGGRASITKTVRNVTAGTDYQGTVSASPLNTVAYRIVVAGVSGTVSNVTVRDAVPSGIVNIRDIQVDGSYYGGNLQSGINLGTLQNGQTKTITYNATVANEANFTYGQTTLTNTATVYVGNVSATSNAAVVVWRRAILGATTISTGFGDNARVGLAIGLAGIILCAVWLLFRALKREKIDAKTLLARKINFIKQNNL